jgi:hypothetical protein
MLRRVKRARAAAAVVSLALIGATLEPLARAPVADGFPLSTYPMFAWRRPTTQTLHYALGETAAGARRTLTPRLVGSGEVLQAKAVIDRAVHGGPAALARVCADIARRVAADASYADVGAIRIVTGTHDAVDYLVRGIVGREHERARCEVAR